MGWTAFNEAEAKQGMRLHRKLASGALPSYTDATGQRWVWLQEGTTAEDALWEVLAELRRVREALTTLERRVGPQEQPRERAGKIVSLTSGAFKKLERLLEPEADEERAEDVA